MDKVIFGIFAHPDDEAFGPAGTLIMETRAGAELHLITVTPGDAGMNPDHVENLAEVRLAEWRQAGQLIGAKDMHSLGYKDGSLNNNQFHEIAEKIEEIVRAATAARTDISIEFMSMDLNGVTGHLDHILVGRVAAYVFYRLKATDKRLSRLRLACLSDKYFPASNYEWVYMDAGRSETEIDETVDAREHLDTIHAVMDAHHSQRHDAQAHLTRLGDDVAANHFIVLS